MNANLKYFALRLNYFLIYLHFIFFSLQIFSFFLLQKVGCEQVIPGLDLGVSQLSIGERYYFPSFRKELIVSFICFLYRCTLRYITATKWMHVSYLLVIIFPSSVRRAKITIPAHLAYGEKGFPGTSICNLICMYLLCSLLILFELFFFHCT